MQKIIRFGAMAWIAIAAGLLLAWAGGIFHHMGLSGAGAVALIIGILGTSVLGIGLMALIFYSDRSHADEDAYHYRIAQGADDHDASS